ncbi:multidrug effflux MFS transporter [Jannaschia pohangensis]|uniref:MFS transporter, DHA1 family, bicyclomycin/chloramphenicol resistance protein n=1 Tax=Jannaschia pohangensis TaxID=390807 RepID=A0A1I3LX83_9RHOB|nr:multidrug effflux MFS transporter [Jannaschia pohangensis]SFI89277.1 MFS transporter, DHA1 family, bicyclomycin/chloramphenicol resistance protein [Jannaschia pohangensis]
MIAMITATIAFSIDAMLPALPEIGAALSPADPNRAQLVIVMFLFGMGTGTFFVGPLSDALGRKTVMVGGAILYSVAAILCTLAPSLEFLLIARFLQGIGGSGPRVAAMAMIRDLYAGRDMARVSSFVMIVFTLVPAIAPLIGAGIIAGFGWRAIFWAFVVFSGVSATWLMLRQPETLAPERRRPLNATRLRLALTEVARHSNVRRAIIVQSLVFGILFATIASVQQIYAVTFDRADSFPIWFGIVAVLSASASFLNARLVVRMGMIWILRRALAAHLVLSLMLAALWMSGLLPDGLRFPVFVVWQVGSFALAGLTIGNLNALAMQPMGHIAGMASSVISAVATIVGASVAAPIGLAFNGTPLPLTLGVALCAIAALFLSRKLSEDAI